ncbi:cell cycle checkpoint protein RAD17 isoform X4 [Manihot esculenta]|uniref:cell cycle checkpoint protein RAD17 isoform X4 n=1 Tax=Manihot esculenta TaxID=3983 RepID=UPI001CC3DBAD|nr:cell cycle checkpoint protein RAD17 isoform X4 [Manihot esculenta]
MGKRNSVVILSSDDEDNESSLSSYQSYPKPKSRRPLITRTNSREPKKPRISGTRSRMSKECSNVNEITFPCGDFDEFFYGSKVSAGSGRNNVKELWVDKYMPRSLEELTVHKKKVEEVKAWFEERLRDSKATIHVIASHFGATLCEWNAPTPTIWQEHLHNASAGIHYTSKLEEFVNFIEKIRKYGVIPSSISAESKSPIILLIDDLPVTHGRVAFERLQNCLLLLVRSTRIPTAVLITDYGKADSADHTARYMEELQLSLESAGACKVAFNPITNNSIRKALSRICKHEQCNMTSEQIDLIAKASGGDIRHAITSLQLFCVKPDLGLSVPLCNSARSHSDRNSDELDALISGFSLLFGRDETLSLFHALGKFLHNKRGTEATMVLDPDAFFVHDKFARLPMRMDAPEKVLCQAHGQARPIADFLHENVPAFCFLAVLDFISDEAMDAAWDVASYLSDADLLLSSFHGVLARYNEAESVLQSAAASVAVRGVLFGNSNPSPSRWHAIRRPKLWQVEQALPRNQKETMSQRYIANGGSSFSSVSDVATEHLPVLKWLGRGASSGVEVHHVRMHQKEAWDDSTEKLSLDNEEGQFSDDEIEDW